MSEKGSISAMQGTGVSDVAHKGDADWVAGQDDKTAQIRIWNNPGVALPSTGGPGTKLFTILGLAMMMGAGVMLFRRRGMI